MVNSNQAVSKGNYRMAKSGKLGTFYYYQPCRKKYYTVDKIENCLNCLITKKLRQLGKEVI
jgi:hypothetical protein